MTDAPNEPRGERALIRRLRDVLDADTGGVAPFGDDMAAVPTADTPLLATVDMLMDGVDFESDKHAWRDIGYKAMAVNLSDCAAMAVQPVAALAAVALQNTLSPDDALALAAGMRDAAEPFGCRVVGGDTNSWDAPTAISVTVFAHAAPGITPVRRDGARVGDGVFVSGRLGGSILGRHLRPTPRVELAQQIARALSPHAMIDISDGLSVDLGHIVEASAVAAELDESLLEAAIHDDARRLAAQDGRPALDHALHDGEDFELIVALPADVDTDACARLGLIRVGKIVAGTGLVLREADGHTRPITAAGWEHFK